jgi:hypothetical protein
MKIVSPSSPGDAVVFELFRHGSENQPGQPASNKWSKYWHDGIVPVRTSVVRDGQQCVCQARSEVARRINRISLLASDEASYVSGIERFVDGGVAQV